MSSASSFEHIQEQFSTVLDDMTAYVENPSLKNKGVQMDDVFDQLKYKADQKKVEYLFSEPKPQSSSANRQFPLMFWPWDKCGWWMSIGLAGLLIITLCIVS